MDFKVLHSTPLIKAREINLLNYYHIKIALYIRNANPQLQVNFKICNLYNVRILRYGINVVSVNNSIDLFEPEE